MSDGPSYNAAQHTLRSGVTMEVRFRQPDIQEAGVQFGCEQCCYYFLQVIFIACIMVGFALAVAGGVLHSQHHDEFVVFVYIGVLLTLVSILLLCIQCYVRRSNKKRQRALQRHVIASGLPADEEEVAVNTYPLTTLSNQNYPPHGGLCSSLAHYHQPVSRGHELNRRLEEPLLYPTSYCRPIHTTLSLPRSEHRNVDLVPPRYNEVWTSKYQPRWQHGEDII